MSLKLTSFKMKDVNTKIEGIQGPCLLLQNLEEKLSEENKAQFFDRILLVIVTCVVLS